MQLSAVPSALTGPIACGEEVLVLLLGHVVLVGIGHLAERHGPTLDVHSLLVLVLVLVLLLRVSE
mgnify:CR=1 FL=1